MTNTSKRKKASSLIRIEISLLCLFTGGVLLIALNSMEAKELDEEQSIQTLRDMKSSTDDKQGAGRFTGTTISPDIIALSDQTEVSDINTAAFSDTDRSDAGTIISSSGSNQPSFVFSEYRELYETNPELFGWISITGSGIDYPVMQTGDNEYYLTHDCYSQENSSGSIFLDARNCGITDTNTIIYGHNMKNGTMFASLLDYADRSFYRTHPDIKLDTLNEHHSYRVIAVCRSKVTDDDPDIFRYYNFINPSSKDQLKLFWENIKAESLFDVDYRFKITDKFLTLSTCTSYTDNGRLYVVAVLEE